MAALAKASKDQTEDSFSSHRRKLSPFTYISHIILALASLLAILPFILMIVASFTDESSLLVDGYSFFPKKISAYAYEYLALDKSMILGGYKISIIVTVIGTVISLLITTMLAFALSQKKFKYRVQLSFVVYFTMLFNGGLVPTYILYAQYLKIVNSLFAQLLPNLLLNAFNVLITRSYFSNNIDDSIVESAVIDGASVWNIYFHIVLPLSTPILATIGLFTGIGYWNDWYNGLIYLTNPKLYSIQNILNRILMQVQFLANSVTDANVLQQANSIPETSVRMALAVVGILPIMIAYPFFQKYFIKGITIGAVKG